MQSLLDHTGKFNPARSILLCVILVAISYYNSLGVPFVWDDYSSVVSNTAIRTADFKNSFKPLYEDESPDLAKAPAYFRPAQILSYALDYRMWKLNPFGYHLDSIILHILNTVLLYFLLFLLFRESAVAFLGSALFGTHPVFTSSVTYISGRADVLVLFFSLLACLAFIGGIRGNRLNLVYYCISLACFMFATSSKELGAISLLFLLMSDKLIYRYTSAKKKRNLIYLPFLFILFFWLYLKPPALPGLKHVSLNLHAGLLNFLVILKGMAVYTFLSVIPWHLRMGRTIGVISGWQDIWMYISILFVVIAPVIYFTALRKNRVFLLGLGWFYLPLLSGMFFNALFAKRGSEILLPEHNLYFCYPGFLIALFALILLVPETKIYARRGLLCICALFVLFYIGSTIAENKIWQDEIRLFERNIRYNKGSAFNFVSYANLGYAYERKGDMKKAEENLMQAAGASGRNPYFYNALAAFYIRQNDFSRAENTLLLSRGIDDNFYKTYLLLGIVYAHNNRKVEACDFFNKALSINPGCEGARQYLNFLQKR